MNYIIIPAVAIVAVVVGAVCGYFMARTRSIAAETLLQQKQIEIEQNKTELSLIVLRKLSRSLLNGVRISPS